MDKKNWFMVGFAKLWIMNGTRTFENSTGSLFNLTKKEIDFLNEEILQIDLEGKNVKTTKEISYDFLIIAMGAVLSPQKISGLAENGLNLYDYRESEKIHDKILNLKSGKIAISIMGMPYKCPPAPFEASLLIDSMLRKAGTRESIQIDVYGPAPITLPAAGPEISNQILDLISSKKIIFHPSCKIKSIESGKMIFQDNQADFDLLLAVPPHIAPKVIYDSGLAQQDNFIPINRDCKTSFENVYAVGDVTSLKVTETMAVPKAGVFAEGEGITVAKSIISKIQSKQDSDLFDGKGGCFIESGHGTASMIKVDMFSESGPSTELTESNSDFLNQKLQFEKERLTKWL